MSVKDKILVVVEDLVVSFTYYDRKEDEYLTREDFDKAFRDKEVSIDDVVKCFREKLEKELS